MARKKVQPPPAQEERWITAREATDILNANSGRTGNDTIKVSYVRTLEAKGKVQKKEKGLDGRTALYRYSDVANYVVAKRDKGKGDTRTARETGSRPKSAQAGSEQGEQKQEEIA